MKPTLSEEGPAAVESCDGRAPVALAREAIHEVVAQLLGAQPRRGALLVTVHATKR